MNKGELLQKLNDKKMSALVKDREEWLNKTNELVSPIYKVQEVAERLKKQSIVQVKEVVLENYNYKSIVLQSMTDEQLPSFRAGQKITITLLIKGKYYTRPFHLSSNPIKSKIGEYRITIKNDENDIVNKYLFHEVIVGEQMMVSKPFGDFYYDYLRDEENVIAIVSDTGILPILSMGQAIISGEENFHLTIFYSEKYEKDLLFKEELLKFAEISSKIRVRFVLSVDKKEDMQSGFVSIDRVKQDFILGKTSIFIAGSEGLLKYLDNELKELKLPKKYIRYDSYLPRCNIRKVVQYKLTMYVNNEKFEIPCYNNKTIMKSIEEAGIYLLSRCGNGSCGFCHSELVFGDVKIVNDKRIKADKVYNYIHPCSTYPLSDIEIIVR